jgi:predicted pyridoxine 5'-phosphate oxidase superfamily flavin-nucleotide-binding protein
MEASSNLQQGRPAISEEVKNFLRAELDSTHNATPGVLATIDQDGYPSAAPKFFVILDDTHIAFADIFSKHLRENLGRNSKVSVVFYNTQKLKGYRIRGIAELEEQGPLFESITTRLVKMGLKPKTLVKVRVEEIRLLQYGSEAGKLIT